MPPRPSLPARLALAETGQAAPLRTLQQFAAAAPRLFAASNRDEVFNGSPQRLLALGAACSARDVDGTLSSMLALSRTLEFTSPGAERVRPFASTSMLAPLTLILSLACWLAGRSAAS